MSATDTLRRFFRKPEFGAFAAFVVTYVFFAFVTHGSGFVSINGTAGWLDIRSRVGNCGNPRRPADDRGRV